MSTDWTSQRAPLGQLPEIDRQILRLVAQGRSSKEIGKALGRSPLTIDSRLKEACLKIGADNRVQAASMLLLEEAASPPNLGGSQDAGIESGVREEPHPYGDKERSRTSAKTSPSSADRSDRTLAETVRSLLTGKGVGAGTPGERLVRVFGAILLASVALALVFFFLANALEAFQGVLMGIRS